MVARRISGWIAVLVITGLAAGLFPGNTGLAQGPQCPPGFTFEPNSGTGCVQENCATIPGSQPSYTGHCICQEGYQACYTGIDYTGFDPASCGPFCPNSALAACIDPKAVCPSDQPAQGVNPGEAPAAAGTDAQQGSSSGEAGDVDESQQGPSIAEMIRVLEDSLVAKTAQVPSLPRSAAAGVSAGMALLVFILALNLPSETTGAPIENIVEHVILEAPQIVNKVIPPPTPVPAGKEPPLMKPDPQSLEKLRQAAESAPPPVEPAPQKSAVTPEKLQALETEFQRLVNEKVKEGHYVMNKDLLSKIWNWSVGLVRDPLMNLEGGQCGEMAHLGQGWVDGFVMKTFGREAIIDKIFIYENSSRYPQNFRDYADALYANNHAATRVILPNGESYILDFWEAISERQGQGEDARSQARITPESEWIVKYFGQIGSARDPAEVANVNPKQAELRDFLQQAGALHPYHASSLPPEQYQQAVQVTQNAIQQWRASRQKISPVETEMLINNWRKYGSLWGSDRADPPADPAQAVRDAGRLVLDQVKKKLQ